MAKFNALRRVLRRFLKSDEDRRPRSRRRGLSGLRNNNSTSPTDSPSPRGSGLLRSMTSFFKKKKTKQPCCNNFGENEAVCEPRMDATVSSAEPPVYYHHQPTPPPADEAVTDIDYVRKANNIPESDVCKYSGSMQITETMEEQIIEEKFETDITIQPSDYELSNSSTNSSLTNVTELSGLSENHRSSDLTLCHVNDAVDDHVDDTVDDHVDDDDNKTEGMIMMTDIEDGKKEFEQMCTWKEDLKIILWMASVITIFLLLLLI